MLSLPFIAAVVLLSVGFALITGQRLVSGWREHRDDAVPTVLAVVLALGWFFIGVFAGGVAMGITISAVLPSGLFPPIVVTGLLYASPMVAGLILIAAGDITAKAIAARWLGWERSDIGPPFYVLYYRWFLRNTSHH